MLGVGLGYPMVYREIVGDIKAGTYGSDMKGLMDSGKYVAVDAENYIYYCDNCGCVECMTALVLYEPKDIEKIEERVVGRWSAVEPTQNETVKELGELPYFNSDDEDIVLLKEYKHVCPKCGEKYQMFSGILWD